MRTSLLLCFLWFSCASLVLAHPNLQNSMWVQFEPKLVRIAVNVSLKELVVASGLSLKEGEAPEAQMLSSAAERHKAYLVSHLRLSIGSEGLPGSVTKLTPPQYFSDPEQTLFQYELEYPYNGKTPKEVEFFHDMLREWPYSQNVSWDLSYVIRSKRMGADQVSSWLLRTSQPSLLPTGLAETALSERSSDLARTGAGPTRASFAEYLSSWFEAFQKGAVRVLAGMNHLLFAGLLVLGLCSPRQLGLALCVFTASHGCAALSVEFGRFEWLKRSSEVAGSVCIVLFALNSVLVRERGLSGTRLLLVSVFGFVSGFQSLTDGAYFGPWLFADGAWGLPAAFLMGIAGAYQAVLLPGFFLLEALCRSEAVAARPSLPRFASAVLGLAGGCSLVFNLYG